MTEEVAKTGNELTHVVIYTDGGCTPNPGPGGYGVVMLHGEKRKELSGGFRKTTNNRMELTAAIVGLQTLRYRCRVTLFTDSQYLSDGISKGWAKSWRRNGWIKSDKKRAINPDLWEALLGLCEKHEVSFKWVRGHSGEKENERCDELSTQAQRAKDLPVDAPYEDPEQFFRRGA